MPKPPVKTTSSVLTKTERKIHLEKVAIVTNGFVQSGQALAWIRDHKSHRETHKTFEAFCKETWEFTSTHARRLIRSSEVVAKIEPIGSIRALNEAQVRPLTTIDLDQVGDVWQEVIEKAPTNNNGNPVITGKHVKETVDHWNEEEDEEDVEDNEEPEPENGDTFLADAKRMFNQIDKQIELLRKGGKELSETREGFLLLYPAFRVKLKEVRDYIKSCLPTQICLDCKGTKCPACRETGYISNEIAEENSDDDEA